MTRGHGSPRRFLAGISILLGVLSEGGLQAGGHLGPVTAIVPREDGILAVSQAGILFHPANPGETRLFAKPEFRVVSAAALPDGNLCAVGGIPGEEGVAAILRRDGTTAFTKRIGKDMLYGVAISPDGQTLAIACADGSVRTGQAGDFSGPWRERQKHTATAIAVAFSPDGKMLASGGLDGVVLISLVASTTEDQDQRARVLDDHSAGVECLAFSPDGLQLASGSRDSKMRVHETATGRLVRTFAGLSMEDEPVAGRVAAHVTCVEWNPKGLFAGTSKGHVLKLSETDDRRERYFKTDTKSPAKSPVTALATSGSLGSGPNSLVIAAHQTLHVRALP